MEGAKDAALQGKSNKYFVALDYGSTQDQGNTPLDHLIACLMSLIKSIMDYRSNN